MIALIVSVVIALVRIADKIVRRAILQDQIIAIEKGRKATTLGEMSIKIAEELRLKILALLPMITGQTVIGLRGVIPVTTITLVIIVLTAITNVMTMIRAMIVMTTTIAREIIIGVQGIITQEDSIPITVHRSAVIVIETTIGIAKMVISKMAQAGLGVDMTMIIGTTMVIPGMGHCG